MRILTEISSCEIIKRNIPLVLYESKYLTDWEQQIKALKEIPMVWNDSRNFRGHVNIKDLY
jgi:hypothetical protein